MNTSLMDGWAVIWTPTLDCVCSPIILCLRIKMSRFCSWHGSKKCFANKCNLFWINIWYKFCALQWMMGYDSQIALGLQSALCDQCRPWLVSKSQPSDHGLHCSLFSQRMFWNFPLKWHWFCPYWKMNKFMLDLL
jgi:hypothetical protein